MGELAVAAARASRSASDGGGAANSCASANHGAVAITTGASIDSPRTSTPITRSPLTRIRAIALVRTSDPRASSHSRAGSAYISSSGTAGSTSDARSASGPNMRESTSTKVSAAASSID